MCVWERERARERERERERERVSERACECTEADWGNLSISQRYSDLALSTAPSYLWMHATISSITCKREFSVPLRKAGLAKSSR